MKSIIALGVGLVVALAPGGTAFAETTPHAVGEKAKAYGNCQHSSAGGTHKPLDGSAGNGNGGHVKGGGKPQYCPEADLSEDDNRDAAAS